jgi:hypothetical protein
MALPSYRRHRFPPEIIQNAIWASGGSLSVEQVR